MLASISDYCLALCMQRALSLMPYTYAFMLSGLLMPVVEVLMEKKTQLLPALVSMIAGRSVSVVLIISKMSLPFRLDANAFGLETAVVLYVFTSLVIKKKLAFTEYYT